LRDAHALHYLETARSTAGMLKSIGQLEGLSLFDREINNLREALRWSARSDNGLLELQLAVALGNYWEFRAHFTEGQRWIDDALERGKDAPAELRGECMRMGAALARGQGEFGRALRLVEGAMTLLEQTDEQLSLADAIKQRGLIAVNQGDVEMGRRMFEQTLEIRDRLKDPQGTGDLLNNLGYIARLNEDYDAAESYFERAVKEYQDHGDLLGSVRVMMNMGELKMEQGDYSGAKGFVRGSLVLCRKIDSRWDYADLLELMAAVQHGYGRGDDAARLLGAASAVREELGAPIPPAEAAIYDERLLQVRKSLGDETFDALWDEGAQMGLQQAIDYALS
jgi:tetratricopeptide (TPR) repeat protein